MPGTDPFSPDPIVLAERDSEYTGGELHALFAPVLGVDAERIKGLVIIADLGGALTFGGTLGTEAAKELLVGAVISGVLNV